MSTEKQKISPEHISCLIFDYGGTLDTCARHWAHVLWEGYSYAMQHLPFGQQLAAVTHEQFREAYVFGERALAKAPIVQPEDNFHTVLVKKLEQEFHCLQEQGYWQGSTSETQMAIDCVADYCYRYAAKTVDESRQVLEQLKDRFRLILVSNFYGNIHAILRDFRLEYFESIIESAVVGVRKPDPAIWQLGIDAAGVPAENCLVIGDSFDKDIVPAQSVGCRTVWLKGEGWTNDSQEDEQIPDAIIYRLDELVAIMGEPCQA